MSSTRECLVSKYVCVASAFDLRWRAMLTCCHDVVARCVDAIMRLDRSQRWHMVRRKLETWWAKDEANADEIKAVIKNYLKAVITRSLLSNRRLRWSWCLKKIFPKNLEIWIFRFFLYTCRHVSSKRFDYLVWKLFPTSYELQDIKRAFNFHWKRKHFFKCSTPVFHQIRECASYV